MEKICARRLTLFVFLSMFIMNSALPLPQGKPGGTGETHLADAKTKGFVTQFSGPIRRDACKKQGFAPANCGTTTAVQAIAFKSQLVQGTNYFIKIQVGSFFGHIRVFEPLPHTMQPAEYQGMQGPETADSPIEFFGPQ